MNWMLLLKSLYVLSAIVAVGSNLTYAVWSARGSIDEAHLGFALRGIKFIDDRIANPAYGVLLITGVLMGIFYLGFAHAWLIAGLSIYAVVAGMAAGVYSPALTRQIAALETGGVASTAYRAADARARAVGIVMGVMVIGAVFIMVIKPEV